MISQACGLCKSSALATSRRGERRLLSRRIAHKQTLAETEKTLPAAEGVSRCALFTCSTSGSYPTGERRSTSPTPSVNQSA